MDGAQRLTLVSSCAAPAWTFYSRHSSPEVGPTLAPPSLSLVDTDTMPVDHTPFGAKLAPSPGKGCVLIYLQWDCGDLCLKR